MVEKPKFIAPAVPTPQSVFANASRLAAVPDPEPEVESAILAEGEVGPNLYPEITHVRDVEIVERMLGVGPHPKTRKPAAYKHVLHALLLDGRKVLVCSWINEDGSQCGYVGKTVLGVNNHYNSVHVRTEFRRYSDELLKAVMRAVAEAKQTPGRDFMARAAMILNGRGLRTVSNVEWTASAVYSIWTRYHKQFPVRTSRRSGGAQPGAGRPKGTKDSPDSTSAKLGRARKISKTLDGLRTIAVMLVEEIDTLIAEGVGEPDPKIAAKAAAWDQMQQNMRALSD